MKTMIQAKAPARSTVAPAAAQMPQPAMVISERVEERPDVATQLEGAARLGHSFAALGVGGAAPPPLQFKPIAGPVRDRYEQEPGQVARQTLHLHDRPTPPAAPPIQCQEAWGTAIGGEVQTSGEGGDAPEVCQENRTGLPDHLKAGLEHLSGLAMDDVKVHYNSDKPTQLQAHAYAQGTNINIAPGQEKHLPHEAWHVVQQKQGRVKPTVQMTGGVNVNDDEGLEREADVNVDPQGLLNLLNHLKSIENKLDEELEY